MISGYVVYADSPALAEEILAEVPQEAAVAIYSRVAYDPPERASWFRVRPERNPDADVAAVSAALPQANWRAFASELEDEPNQANLRERYHERHRGNPLHIEAVAVACGGDCHEELEIFVRQWKFWAPRIAIYALTDAETAKRLPHDLRDHIAVLDIVDEADLEQWAGNFPERGPRWSKPWIGAKLEALRRAIAKWDCGVMLCDSDLILRGPVPRQHWHADVVLSSHRGPHHTGRVPSFHGHWNAGMLLTRSLKVVARWKELYESGAGTFFEQQCLEQLSDEFVADTFPSAWNWGGWRNRENLAKSGRKPLILHTHLVGPWANEPQHESAQAVKQLARESVQLVKRSQSTEPRFAFVHFAKAAGTSHAAAFREQIAPQRGYQYLGRVLLTGPHYDGGMKGRDYTSAELHSILAGHYAGLHSERWIVHNHAQNWTERTARAYAREGVTMLAFYRPIRERLLSFFYWSERKKAEHGWTPLREPASLAKTLEEFVEVFLDTAKHVREWYLPDWAVQCCDWFPATDEGLVQCADKYWGVEIKSPTRNTSPNPGWNAAIEQGLLSEALIDQVENDPRVKAWDDFAREQGFDMPRSA